MVDVPCCVGIDVAKAQWDIALRPAGERWAVPNDASGIAPLVDRRQALQPTLIVLEATGGLERAAAAATRRPDARVAGSAWAPPATDRHAHRGAAPPGRAKRAPDEGYDGA